MNSKAYQAFPLGKSSNRNHVDLSYGDADKHTLTRGKQRATFTIWADADTAEIREYDSWGDIKIDRCYDLETTRRIYAMYVDQGYTR